VAVEISAREQLLNIYGPILSHHMQGFSADCRKMCKPLLEVVCDITALVAVNTVGFQAALEVFFIAREHFLATPSNFHYQWNLRELSAFIQGFCM
jgi:hypothetical protein